MRNFISKEDTRGNQIDRKIIILVVYLIVLSTNVIFAQLDTLWTKALGSNNEEFGSAAYETADGGFIIVGSKESIGEIGSNILIVKTNSLGDTIWTKSYSDTATAFYAEQTSDGGLIITGILHDYYDYIWLLKTDSLGDTLWTKRYGSKGRDIGFAVHQTNDGGYIIAGNTEKIFGIGDWDLWLIKTDSKGDSIWTKTYGGVSSDLGFSCTLTHDGGYAITGINDSFGSNNLWVVRTNSLGDTLWTTIYGDSSIQLGNSIQETKDNGFIITGKIHSFDDKKETKRVLLIKLDSGGKIKWSKSYHKDNSSEGYDVLQTIDGGYIIAASTYSAFTYDDTWIIKTNELGDTLWTKLIRKKSYDSCISISQTIDGGYILAGTLFSGGDTGNDIWLVRLINNSISGIKDLRYSPKVHYLFQNYPNPFNPSTQISYHLAVPSHVELAVYDILGRPIAILVSARQAAGDYTVSWQATEFAAGVYVYKLKAGRFSQVKRMILLK